jgi:plastocyanin
MIRSPLLLALSLVLAAAPVVAQSTSPSHKPGGFHSPNIEPGAFWDLRLAAPGMYYYHCDPHPFMHGTIQVTENTPRVDVVEVAIQDFKYHPENLVVRPNATITFTNKDTVMHTAGESLPPASTVAKKGSAGPGALGACMVLALVLVLRRWSSGLTR